MPKIRNASPRKAKVNTLGIELKKFDIQGKRYTQQNVNFEYRLRVIAKDLWGRWSRYYRTRVEKTIREMLRVADFKTAMNYVTFDDLNILATSVDKAVMAKVQAKLAKLKREAPNAFEELTIVLSFLTTDMEEAQDLFIAENDRENLKALFEVMLKEDASAINYTVPDSAKQLELDRVGKEVLLTFFTWKNNQIF